MNVDVRKQEMLNDIYTLEKDCKLLLGRIPKFREDLLKIKTEEDLLQFGKTHNLEEGLEITILYKV